jgi:hypothetical protein
MNDDADTFQRDKLIARQITNTLLHSFLPEDEFLLESGFEEAQLAAVRGGLDQVNQRIMDAVKSERTPEVELEFALRIGALRNGQSSKQKKSKRNRIDDDNDDNDDNDDDVNDDDNQFDDYDRISIGVPLHRLTGADLPKVWPNSNRQATYEQLRSELCDLERELVEINAASALIRATERQLAAAQTPADLVDALAEQLKENNAKAAELAHLLKGTDSARLARIADRANK